MSKERIKRKNGLEIFQVGEGGKAVLFFGHGDEGLLVIPEGVRVRQILTHGELGPVLEKETYKVELGEEFLACNSKTKETALIKVGFNEGPD